MNSDAVLQDDDEHLTAAVDFGGRETFSMIISPTGALTFVWDDALQPLCELGQPTIERASHVEPIAAGPHAGQWSADMSPIGGPLLGPHKLRSEALTAERDWLRKNKGL